MHCLYKIMFLNAKCQNSACAYLWIYHVESELTIHSQKYVFSLSENEIRD